MIFEDLPTTPTSEELLDKAFSRAARAGRAKSGVEAQESMLQTASNVLSDNLHNVVTAWPDFDGEVEPFYRELADAVVGVDEARAHLSEVTWASRKTKELGREYIGRLPRDDADAAKKLRKQAFARMGSVLREVEDDLQFLNEARDDLKTFPDIRPDEPAIVVAGYPNVGKSSFVNDVTNARNETAKYPFTTKAVRVGHVERDHVRYQLVDTPGLLDRPADERNDIEEQAVSALTHLADAVLFMVDASATCGYPLDDQLALREDVHETFANADDDVGFLTVCNKSDVSTDVEADAYMSVETGENVDGVLAAAVDATGYELELPLRD
ncbi:GTP-binding protein, gtp1/obg family [Halarchaeum acidiphilum MH1-52-1]|uniref:GTP-binding protein, gtp1/obg family n=1 Tax=Halarchaeum acidiphilum MH1-52-1 TaxID=1261545 RepID=U3A584_9EURY|nr:NOG1 family protein [Halarchaeum acidiphilum]GAD52799.1 GTP-binding protein, gtp1/obg family [Halarchaeum acidiphilum MH1-52-1]